MDIFLFVEYLKAFSIKWIKIMGAMNLALALPEISNFTKLSLKFIGKNYNWDNLEKCYPSVVNIGGKIYMIYSGNNYGKTGIGYSVLK